MSNNTAFQLKRAAGLVITLIALLVLGSRIDKILVSDVPATWGELFAIPLLLIFVAIFWFAVLIAKK